MNHLTIAVGELLFAFATYEQWVNKNQSWYANCGVHRSRLITVDPTVSELMARNAE